MYFFLSSFTFVHINSNLHCICYIISIIKTTYLFSYIGNSYDFKHVDIICRDLVSRISAEHTLQKLCWQAHSGGENACGCICPWQYILGLFYKEYSISIVGDEKLCCWKRYTVFKSFCKKWKYKIMKSLPKNI